MFGCVLIVKLLQKNCWGIELLISEFLFRCVCGLVVVEFFVVMKWRLLGFRVTVFESGLVACE